MAQIKSRTTNLAKPSDDIISKLREIASTKVGDPMPTCLRQPNAITGYELLSDWGTPLAQIANDAADLIEKLQTTIHHMQQSTE